jgi:hypothetical protein
MQPNKPDRPNRPNEQDRLVDFFSILLETAVKAHFQAQATGPKGFSTAPQFTKTVNSSMALNGWHIL